MGVLDRLDEQAATAQATQQALVNATQAICQAQHLPYSLDDIEQAVQAELKAPSPVRPVAAPVAWGWKRPERPVITGQPTRMERAMRWLGARGGACLVRPLVPGVSLLAVMLTLNALLPLPAGGHALMLTMGMIMSFASWMFSDELARKWIKTHCEDREETSVNEWDLKRWAGIPRCRRYVQACLASANPYLMRADVAQLTRLTEAHHADAVAHARQAASQRFEAARPERTARLEAMFND